MTILARGSKHGTGHIPNGTLEDYTFSLKAQILCILMPGLPDAKRYENLSAFEGVRRIRAIPKTFSQGTPELRRSRRGDKENDSRADRRGLGCEAKTALRQWHEFARSHLGLISRGSGNSVQFRSILGCRKRSAKPHRVMQLLKPGRFTGAWRRYIYVNNHLEGSARWTIAAVLNELPPASPGSAQERAAVAQVMV